MRVRISSNNNFLKLGVHHLLKSISVHSKDNIKTAQPQNFYTYGEKHHNELHIIDLVHSENVIRTINETNIEKNGRTIFIVSDSCYSFIVKIYIIKGVNIIPASIAIKKVIKLINMINGLTSIEFKPLHPAIRFTIQEQKVLSMQRRKISITKVATILKCDVKTIYTHNTNAMKKLKVRNRIDLYKFLCSPVSEPFF